MFTIYSMTHATILIVLTVALLLFLSLRRNPLLAGSAFVREMLGNRKYMIHFTAMLTILLFNKVELWLESKMTPQPDFTHYLYSIEGNFTAVFQRFLENGTLTYISTFFYVVVFPALMIVSICMYTYNKQYRLFHAFCYALMLNYMLAIPFYLFFPVSEVWYYHPQVEFLIPRVFPSFEIEYRPLSGIDNCFPSLHTSISVTVAVIAAKSGNLFWKRFTKWSAVFIIFSIVYLGVHWITDMAGGLVLGFFAAKTALLLSEGRVFAGSVGESPLKNQTYED